MANGRFAAAGRADKRKGFSLRNVKAYTAQHVFIFSIAAENVFKADIAANRTDVTGIRRIRLGLCIHDFEKTFKAGNAVLVLL